MCQTPVHPCSSHATASLPRLWEGRRQMAPSREMRCTVLSTWWVHLTTPLGPPKHTPRKPSRDKEETHIAFIACIAHRISIQQTHALGLPTHRGLPTQRGGLLPSSSASCCCHASEAACDSGISGTEHPPSCSACCACSLARATPSPAIPTPRSSPSSASMSSTATQPGCPSARWVGG